MKRRGGPHRSHGGLIWVVTGSWAPLVLASDAAVFPTDVPRSRSESRKGLVSSQAARRLELVVARTLQEAERGPLWRGCTVAWVPPKFPCLCFFSSPGSFFSALPKLPAYAWKYQYCTTLPN